MRNRSTGVFAGAFAALALTTAQAQPPAQLEALDKAFDSAVAEMTARSKAECNPQMVNPTGGRALSDVGQSLDMKAFFTYMGSKLGKPERQQIMVGAVMANADKTRVCHDSRITPTPGSFYLAMEKNVIGIDPMVGENNPTPYLNQQVLVASLFLKLAGLKGHIQAASQNDGINYASLPLLGSVSAEGFTFYAKPEFYEYLSPLPVKGALPTPPPTGRKSPLQSVRYQP